MDCARSWVWAVVTTVAIGCTPEVEENGFTFGPPADTNQPPGITTFEDTLGSSSEGSGVASMGGSADESSGSATTTDAPGTTTEAPGTTTEAPGTTTSSEECNPPCAADEMCVLGACVADPPACNDVPGNYAECLGPGNVVDTTGCGGGDNCLTGGDPVIAGVCSVTPCVDTCDCPAAPATGNAPIACDAITGGVEQFCYLDCSGGQTCPNGMICFASLACVWPGDGADGVPYGDCLNGGPSTCGVDGVCLNDDVMAPSVGVCTQDCVGAGACPASPGGTAPVSCEDVTGDGLNECVLDCSTGGSCPAGMTCFAGFICMWD